MNSQADYHFFQGPVSWLLSPCHGLFSLLRHISIFSPPRLIFHFDITDAAFACRHCHYLFIDIVIFDRPDY
jgi:hypothetical protein